MHTNKNLRWYDREPTLSLAVSLLKSTRVENQILVAELILSRAEEHNIQIKETTFNKITNFIRRWYDTEETLFKAFEYLRHANNDIQKNLAIEIIDYLCLIDESADKDLV